MKKVRVVLGLPFMLVGMAFGVFGVALVAVGLRIQGESLVKVG